MPSVAGQHKCVVCGARHLLTEANAITNGLCKQVPAGFVWLDRAYKTGPRGALIPLKDNVTEENA